MTPTPGEEVIIAVVPYDEFSRLLLALVIRRTM